MTVETGVILAILFAAVILFITEKLRVDLIALLAPRLFAAELRRHQYPRFRS